MPMTRIPLSGIETETSSVDSKTSTLHDIVNPSSGMPTVQKDILQIIRKEEDHAMSLLAASPLLSSLFLTYANRAAALDGPPVPSPIDKEWMEMKAINNRLQEEVALLRDQLEKETDRAKTAEDYVEALRAQLSSLKDRNNELEVEALREHLKVGDITSEYANYQKNTTNTIEELEIAVEKEAGARAALSQVIADQQMMLAQLKQKAETPSTPTVVAPSVPFIIGPSTPTVVSSFTSRATVATPPHPEPAVGRKKRRSNVPTPQKNEETTKQTDIPKQPEVLKQSKDVDQLGDTKQKECTDPPKDDNKDEKDALGPKEGDKDSSTSTKEIKVLTSFGLEPRARGGGEQSSAKGLQNGWLRSMMDG